MTQLLNKYNLEERTAKFEEIAGNQELNGFSKITRSPRDKKV